MLPLGSVAKTLPLGNETSSCGWPDVNRVGTVAEDSAPSASHAPVEHDELDDLIDELDQMDL